MMSLRKFIDMELSRRTKPEREAWKRSEEYLDLFCRMHGNDPRKCGRELEQLAALRLRDSQEGWDGFYAGCLAEAKEQGIEGPEALKTAKARAERMMVDLGYRPPHWTNPVNCCQCGPVLVDPSLGGCELENCPWCGSWLSSIRNRIDNDTEEEIAEGCVTEAHQYFREAFRALGRM